MNRNNAEKQIKHFDERADAYYKARNQDKNVYYRKLLFSYCLRGITTEKDKILVLEPMCGYGTGKKIVDALFGSDRVIYEGFDASPEIINIAKEINPDVNFQVKDILDFSVEEQYDVVVIVGGIHHVPDFAADVLKRIYNALVPGGIFINFEPTYNNVIMKLATGGIYRRNSSFEEATERRFSLDELNFLYKSAGFKLKRQLYPGLFAYLLWYNPQIFKKLNIGNKKFIKKVVKKECKLYTNLLGKKWSVSTFSVLEKVKGAL